LAPKHFENRRALNPALRDKSHEYGSFLNTQPNVQAEHDQNDAK
jgi:hypothetical protein